MRLKVEIDGLTPDQWDHAQKVLQARYEIPDGASRACLLLMYEGEERHVELPASRLSGFLMGLNLVSAFKELTRAMKIGLSATPQFRSAGSSDHNPWPFGEPEEDQENQRAEDSETEEFLGDQDRDA